MWKIYPVHCDAALNKFYCKGNRGTLNDASKEVGLNINVEQTKYMLLSRLQNAGQNRDIKIVNIVLKCVTVQYFGTTVTNQNLIQEEIKRRQDVVVWTRLVRLMTGTCGELL
jgi:hypothetical protein